MDGYIQCMIYNENFKETENHGAYTYVPIKTLMIYHICFKSLFKTYRNPALQITTLVPPSSLSPPSFGEGTPDFQFGTSLPGKKNTTISN